MIIHNVNDRRYGWIGSWEAEPLDAAALTEADVGRTVIYQAYGKAEAGTISSWNEARTIVWAKFGCGETAAGCAPASLSLATRSKDGPDRT